MGFSITYELNPLLLPEGPSGMHGPQEAPHKRGEAARIRATTTANCLGEPLPPTQTTEAGRAGSDARLLPSPTYAQGEEEGTTGFLIRLCCANKE